MGGFLRDLKTPKIHSDINWSLVLLKNCKFLVFNFNFFLSLGQFFLTVGQNNFGNKIPFPHLLNSFGDFLVIWIENCTYTLHYYMNTLFWQSDHVIFIWNGLHIKCLVFPCRYFHYFMFRGNEYFEAIFIRSFIVNVINVW